ncbi:MraY family glycosyltransferase [Pseudomonas fluorescens]|uniref:Glycosyltransferase family 4 protein n=1 Tax=Pseudomonas fluorescens TaxID=294 RepID=A0A944DUY4_PSEFL|nr:glycosyltransferase family 4 protein [Pseudomonas fluorescens]MBT2294345.1 glycosyltransferase family 4 protein [Pseudomonas fluorescens]MBT2306999.1 glycosyltransferase family 4 protein [Pseudomonas fluorescens]MBT2316091.1 glycosyltransferase family 4 protein [Pseudomonas fluorescens]MBT2327546.1 glycosyltransferase family 4 protein [Pseudomonas fluorescens]MBT2342673.1 glycosyltransferase family 4 protein [Pseudomonas fluorescens]
MGLFVLLVMTVVLSVLLSCVIRSYAIHKNVLDVPVERSSHCTPTPRGGGIAIVLSFALGLVTLKFAGGLTSSTLWALLVSGGGIALLGFLDDHKPIAVRWRLLGHFLASGGIAFYLNGIPPIDIFGLSLITGELGYALATVYLVWMLNLYNFMDGIDGIASVEAISVCLAACLLYRLSGFYSLISAPLILVMAVSGFLFWNFPVARIFMGDGGSGFLGITLGVLSLQAAWILPKFLWVWLILLGVFIVDATVTLLWRLLMGERIYEAHRSHAYQFASRRLGSHIPVTLTVAVINFFWLLPVAACVILWGLDGAIGLVVAYTPLVFLVFWLRRRYAEA